LLSAAVPESLGTLEVMDHPPWSGSGLLGWLRRRTGNGASASVAMIEELFGPHRHQGRQTIQEQRQAAAPTNAPGEPRRAQANHRSRQDRDPGV
jgi:hypothetical protein